MNTDSDLLRRYIEDRSEPAFTELVHRHLELVYSVALRRVGGDVQLAEDVAQNVFRDLARKAPALLTRPTLSGWLYTSTHLASAAVVRGERRRKVRETEAHLMQTMLSPADADWARLRPVIDDVIVALKDDEREAIALRFFEKRSFAEVGTALRVTEEAARKRVDRALDKLRSLLESRGVTSTAGALGTALTTAAATAVPTGLGAKIAGHAMATAGVAGSGVTLAGWLAIALPAAAVVALGVLAVGQHQTNAALQRELSQWAVDRTALAPVAAENRALARNLADVATLRRTAAGPLPELPRSSVVAAPPPERAIAASISVTPAGTLQWNEDFVGLAEFLQRLRRTKANADPEARLLVRAPGATYSAIAYVIEEARKAGIEHLTVEAGVKPDDKFPLWLF
jgi:RNA polymerase sigma factor (sigma-70 family)